ncbi:MAG: helix-turn-helix transcriptional regulator [Reichenbachiella sp.]|uniref:helix-turn-helix transcriptional regulator n=1 Tax=Reichenbachiella sp. TaxID=2184521 RepID=UPI00329875C2
MELILELIEQENLIFKAGDTGIYLGKVEDNAFHHHYALQLTIGIDDKFVMETEEGKLTSDSLIIHPQISHRLDSKGKFVLIFLFNPASTIGHFLAKHLTTSSVQDFEEEWVNYLRMFAKDLFKNEINEKTFLSACINSMAEFNSRCLLTKHQMDKRVLATLQYLDRHAREIIPLKEMAEEMCLSESRFQHIFKEETGISYRRMQLWKRLLASFDHLRTTKTLTELAHQSGFSDSSHYSKTFKESFGFSPSDVFANSHLVLE